MYCLVQMYWHQRRVPVTITTSRIMRFRYSHIDGDSNSFHSRTRLVCLFSRQRQSPIQSFIFSRSSASFHCFRQVTTTVTFPSSRLATLARLPPHQPLMPTRLHLALPLLTFLPRTRFALDLRSTSLSFTTKFSTPQIAHAALPSRHSMMLLRNWTL